MTRSVKADQSLPISVKRTMGLETAAGMIGQAKLAEALAIDPRSLRNKLSADRGISDADLIAAAWALNARADQLNAHAAKLRAEALP